MQNPVVVVRLLDGTLVSWVGEEISWWSDGQFLYVDDCDTVEVFPFTQIRSYSYESIFKAKAG